MIGERLRKSFPDFIAHGLAGKFPHGFLHLLPKIIVALRPACETDDCHCGRQFALGGKIVKRGNQFPVRQIASSAEDYDAARLRHRARRQSFAQRIHLLLSGTVHESTADYADLRRLHSKNLLSWQSACRTEASITMWTFRSFAMEVLQAIERLEQGPNRPTE